MEQEPWHGPADPDFSVACLSFSPNVQAAHESRKGSVAIIVVEWSSSALVGMCPISTSPASWLTWTRICPLERIKRQSPLIPTSFPLDVFGRIAGGTYGILRATTYESVQTNKEAVGLSAEGSGGQAVGLRARIALEDTCLATPIFVTTRTSLS